MSKLSLQVPDEGVRLVLGGDSDAADAGVQRVGEREIDDPALAAEIDRRLGPRVGHFVQAGAPAACQHVGHGVAREGRIAGRDGWHCCSLVSRGRPGGVPAAYGDTRVGAMARVSAAGRRLAYRHASA